MGKKEVYLFTNVLFEMISQPVKFNNKIYIGNKPLINANGNILFPIIEIMKCDSSVEFSWNDSSKILCIEENQYEFISYKEKELNNIRNYMICELLETIYVNYEFIQMHLGWNVHNPNGKGYTKIIYIDNYKSKFNYKWLGNRFIAHALGGIDNHDYLNCLEGFNYNYARGHRVFEADFSLTSDNELVLFHDWNENVGSTLGINVNDAPMNLKEFMGLKIFNRYTPLSAEQLLNIMNEYEDIFIVTDMKEYSDEKVRQQFIYIIELAKKINIEILDRLIPQIYNIHMLNVIMELYNWKSVIFSFYNLFNFEYEPLKIIEFAYENGIRALTVSSNRAHDLFAQECADRDICVYAHTYDKKHIVNELIKRGIYGFYTNYLSPQEFDDEVIIPLKQ